MNDIITITITLKYLPYYRNIIDKHAPNETIINQPIDPVKNK